MASTQSVPAQQFDIIVVGGGSAGCVVAARLAAEGKLSVLLLEYGSSAEAHPITFSAHGFADAFAHPDLMMDRLSQPQPHCQQRSLYLGSGTGMGGSGAVNGMVYTRGDRRDYTQWPTGWQWHDVAPAFTALEAALGVQPRTPTLFTERFMQSAVAAGWQRKDGMNDGDLCGYMGYQDMNYRDQQRRSAYVALIKGQRLPNLTVRTGARVERVLSDGARATGVQYRWQGQSRSAAAQHEVVLCAGALETPKLLLLSGIGPAGELRDLGIPLVLDSPGVGKHLQDHPNVCLFYRGQQVPDVNYPQVYGFARATPESHWQDRQADTCYVLYAAHASLQQSLQRLLPAVLLPVAWYRQRWLHRLLRALVQGAFKVPLLTQWVNRLYGVVVILGKTRSRGELTLKSSNPDEPACIDPGYFKQPEDLDTLVDGVQRAVDILRQPAMREWGNHCLIAAVRKGDRRAIARWIQQAVMTTFHYCGTCRLGAAADDPLDSRLRLKGLQGLRVADASVIPEIPVSAINAPTMMIAWRAADFILADLQSNNRMHHDEHSNPSHIIRHDSECHPPEHASG